MTECVETCLLCGVSCRVRDHLMERDPCFKCGCKSKKRTRLIDTRVDGAVLSDDGKYRYVLVRRFDITRSDALVWLMLNPSTADASSNDPTIRKCVRFAKLMGFGAIIVVNLFAYRTPKPEELRTSRRKGIDIIGPDNDEYTVSATTGRHVIAAWGASRVPMIERRIDWVSLLCKYALRVDCLGLSAPPNRQPLHPLMLPYSTGTEPFVWHGAAS